MKKLSNGAIFLIVCGCLFVFGAALAIGGYLAGGSSYFETDIPEAPPKVTSFEDYEFSSIESTGAVDLEIVGSKYYLDALDEHDITDISPETGRVIIISPQDKELPEIKTMGDKLEINAGKDDTQFSVGNLKIYETTVIVLAGDELDEIKVSSSACNADVRGVKFNSADLGMNAGDADLKDVVSGGLKVYTDAGEISVSGELHGTTDLFTDAGDIDVYVSYDPRTYSMDLKTGAGTISIEDKEMDGDSYTQTRSDEMLRLKTDAGDIEIERK